MLPSITSTWPKHPAVRSPVQPIQFKAVERNYHYQWIGSPLGASVITVPSAEMVFLKRVCGGIEANITNSNFGVEWLADEVNLSPRQLQRRLRTSLKLSAGLYIRHLRLQRAAQLLAQRAGSVAEVAYAVGFRDARHFARLFKKTYGAPPSVYAAKGRST